MFAANPLVLFEAIGNAHNDLLVTTFLVWSILLLKKKSTLSGPFFLFSILVKFFTLPLAPLFFFSMVKKLSRRKLHISLVISLITILGTALPFWGNGHFITGLLEGMRLSQENMTNISLHSLIKEYMALHNYPDYAVIFIRVLFGFLIVVASLLSVLVYKKGRKLEQVMIDVLVLFLATITLLYQWYLLPLLALIALSPSRSSLILLFTLTIFGLISYPMSVWALFTAQMGMFYAHVFLSLFLLIPLLVYQIWEMRPFIKVRW